MPVLPLLQIAGLPPPRRAMARIDSQPGNKPLGSLSGEQTEIRCRHERVGQADDKTPRALPRICALKRR